MRAPMLRVTTPNEKPYALRLGPRRITLGRAPGCDVVLPDRLCSLRHAEIFVANGRIRVRDLGSSNGLYLNGVRRMEGVLRPGDNVRLGNSVLQFAFEEQAGEEDLVDDEPTN